MAVAEIKQGVSPIILGLPHTGTEVPSDIRQRLSDNGKLLSDTDWHIHRLYEGLLPNATMVRSTVHRYVIDANRDPTGQSLYPGQNTTGLVPITDFDGNDIWRGGGKPDADEIKDRIAAFHAPYHKALRAEIERVKSIHGLAILYDCHSIRSHIPFLFEGRLPDFNVGTNLATTCSPEIEAAVTSVCARAIGYTHVVNGRFKGGWTTRHYGRPADGVHAVQMELAQSTHLAQETAPFDYDEAKAARLRPYLQDILERLEHLALSARL